MRNNSILMEKSKRGRRPKIPTSLNNLENLNSDTPIIAHLPIDLSEVINEQSEDIFIKSEFQNENEIKFLKKKIDELTNKLVKYEKNIKPSVSVCTGGIRCWWDKHSFDTPMVEIPDSYFNGLFNCDAKFCSWDCMMAYNIDLNDENVCKRTSLIHMKYKKAYGEFRMIKPAPSWKILEEFGGTISIDVYRMNLITNDVNYMYIKAPMISRISYIETVPIKKENEENFKVDDLVLKRSKPLKSSKYSLESIMGIKKIVNAV